MKKALAIIFCAILFFALSGCSITGPQLHGKYVAENASYFGTSIHTELDFTSEKDVTIKFSAFTIACTYTLDEDEVVIYPNIVDSIPDEYEFLRDLLKEPFRGPISEDRTKITLSFTKLGLFSTRFAKY